MYLLPSIVYLVYYKVFAVSASANRIFLYIRLIVPQKIETIPVLIHPLRQLPRTTSHHDSTMLHLLLIFLLPFAVYAEKLIHVDWAITSGRGATLDDCAWSLLNENALGGNHVVMSKARERVKVCANEAATSCDASLVGWKFEYCVQRYDTYYHEGQVPKTNNVFQNSHGLCYYRPYSDNAGNSINKASTCNCVDVNPPDDGSCF